MDGNKEPAFSWIELLTTIIWDYPRAARFWAITNFVFAPIDLAGAILLPGHPYYESMCEIGLGMLILAVLRLVPKSG
jgi:hypothetical protein